MPSIVKRVTDVAARIVLKPATVGAITTTGRFRTIELTGDRLAGADWTPGDKLRVRADDGFSLRTYTPIAWDDEAGSTRVLAYVHGDGPGSDWAQRAQPGDGCQVLGPDHSIRLDRLEARPVFVGDETSFGLLVALRSSRPELSACAALFEVTDADASAAALRAYDIDDVHLTPRASSDAHLDAFTSSVLEVVRAHPDAPLVISGRAQTIAAVRKVLKSVGVASATTLVKAYWDVNRKGLD